MKTMSTQKLVTNVTKVLCETAKEWKRETSVMLLTGEWISTLWFNRAMEYAALQRTWKELLIYNNADGSQVHYVE